MLVVEVWCLPPKQKEIKLNRLHQAIVSAVSSIPGLLLNSEKDMVCLFPPDLMKYGLGDEIIVKIYGLYEEPRSNRENRQKLAERVGNSVKELYPDAKVECFVFTFELSQGFWTSGS